MVRVKNGIADYEEMDIKEFCKWIRTLEKSIGKYFKIYIQVDIGADDNGT